jgi:DNA polymerase III delta subunit
MVVTTSLVLVFLQLLKYHGLKDRNRKMCSSYWVNPYFLKEYDVALKLSYEKVSQIVASLRDIDVKAKE